jgi:hypothetical protein
LDTFQDGGLKYNNPAFLASWEAAFLWPDRCQILEPNNGKIDQMLSLGTGTAASVKYKVGPHSPVKDRFPKRLFGWAAGNLCGQKQWEIFFECVPPHLRGRYHRLNLFFRGSEPRLDEVSAIERLKRQAQESVFANPEVTLAKDSMIASIFYFELDSCVKREDNRYSCSGAIRCRLPLDYAARKKLYQLLVTSSAFFLLSGRPVLSLGSIPKGIPSFRCRVDFVIRMDEEVSISIRGVTSRPTFISGMPRRLHYLLEAQGLYAPFGCIDHREPEKPLPETPSKRKACME